MSRIRSTCLVLFVALICSAVSDTASAHFPFHRHCFARPWCPPRAVVWGGWPGYSFYSYRASFCAPVFYQPVVYTPVIYTPVIYRPAVCAPVIYDPVIYDPVPCATAFPTLSVSSTTTNPRWASLQSASAQRVVRNNTGLRVASVKNEAKPVLTTYSPIWTEAAVGLIDDMMDRGEWELAHQSLQRMDKLATPVSHRVLLRQAVMDLVAHRQDMTTPDLDRIMDRFARAAQEGSQLASEELRGNSLSAYLGDSGISLEEDLLDRLAQRVLRQPEQSGRELLLLSVLLNMDGQKDRAQLFANESRAMAAQSDSFRWHAVLRTLDRHTDSDALLAANR
jgi:hypothetical protein